MRLSGSIAGASLLMLGSAVASPNDPAYYQCNPAHQYPPGQCCDGQALTLYTCNATTSTPPPPVQYTTITTKCSTANGTTTKPYLLTYTTPCPTGPGGTPPPPGGNPPPAGGNPPPAGGNPPAGTGSMPKGPTGTSGIPQYTGAAVANFAGSAALLGALAGGLAFLI